MGDETKQFCRVFKCHQDLLLLDEVSSTNLYFSENKQQAWNEIMDSLNKVPLFAEQLNERAEKDRLMKLVTMFRKEDVRNRVLSGTEEQYGKMEELLANIDSLIKDSEELSKEKKRVKVQKEQDMSRVSKFIKLNGELGRNAQEHDEESADHKYPVEGYANFADFQSQTGLDQRDRDSLQKIERIKAKESGEISELPLKIDKTLPFSSSEPSFRTSRVRKEDELELKWIEIFKEQDDRKYACKEKELAVNLAWKEKELAEKSAIRHKELDVEKLKLEVEAKKWDFLSKNSIMPQKE